MLASCTPGRDLVDSGAGATVKLLFQQNACGCSLEHLAFAEAFASVLQTLGSARPNLPVAGRGDNATCQDLGNAEERMGGRFRDGWAGDTGLSSEKARFVLFFRRKALTFEEKAGVCAHTQEIPAQPRGYASRPSGSGRTRKQRRKSTRRQHQGPPTQLDRTTCGLWKPGRISKKSQKSRLCSARLCGCVVDRVEVEGKR